MIYQELARIAEVSGFSAWAELDVATIDLKMEVRDMCAVNSCGQYGKRWSCPPGCGTLEECAERLKGYSRGILVQTYGMLVLEICKANGLTYYYGPDKMAYTSCFLLK